MGSGRNDLSVLCLSWCGRFSSSYRVNDLYILGNANFSTANWPWNSDHQLNTNKLHSRKILHQTTTTNAVLIEDCSVCFNHTMRNINRALYVSVCQWATIWWPWSSSFLMLRWGSSNPFSFMMVKDIISTCEWSISWNSWNSGTKLMCRFFHQQLMGSVPWLAII